jgi:uncharacterized repeat protein (TIGR03943 family)
MVRRLKQRWQRRLASAAMWLPAVVFAVWFNVYYWLLEGGRYRAYLQPGLWPLLVLALGILAAFVAASLFWQAHTATKTGGIDAWLNTGVWLLPVVFLWLFFGQGLGTDAFTRKAPDLQNMAGPAFPTAERLPRIDTGGPSAEFMRLLKNPAHFDHRRLTIEGSVYRDPEGAAGRFLLFRFLVVCCAADAMPIGIPVFEAPLPMPANDDWVRVTGRVRIAAVKQRPTPEIIAERVEILPAPPPPQERYLYYGW